MTKNRSENLGNHDRKNRSEFLGNHGGKPDLDLKEPGSDTEVNI